MYQLVYLFAVKVIPGVLCILGFLPLVLIEPTTIERRLDPVAPEQTVKVVTGNSQLARIENAVSVTAIGRMAFAFGYLEFDWDPRAPSGVPGFDSWPKHNLSVAEASPRN